MNAIKAVYGGSFFILKVFFNLLYEFEQDYINIFVLFRDIPAIPLLKRECSAQHRRQGSRTICHTGA